MDRQWGETPTRRRRPVAMYGCAAFPVNPKVNTCRALPLIQMLLGAPRRPGNFRARAPYPRRLRCARCREKDPAVILAPDTALSGWNGTTPGPSDLVVDREGNQLRIERAYSWESRSRRMAWMHW